VTWPGRGWPSPGTPTERSHSRSTLTPTSTLCVKALGKLYGRRSWAPLLSALLSIGRRAAAPVGNCLVGMEAPAGIEPATSRLQGVSASVAKSTYVHRARVEGETRLRSSGRVPAKSLSCPSETAPAGCLLTRRFPGERERPALRAAFEGVRKGSPRLGTAPAGSGTRDSARHQRR